MGMRSRRISANLGETWRISAMRGLFWAVASSAPPSAFLRSTLCLLLPLLLPPPPLSALHLYRLLPSHPPFSLLGLYCHGPRTRSLSMRPRCGRWQPFLGNAPHQISIESPAELLSSALSSASHGTMGPWDHGTILPPVLLIVLPLIHSSLGLGSPPLLHPPSVPSRPPALGSFTMLSSAAHHHLLALRPWFHATSITTSLLVGLASFLHAFSPGSMLPPPSPPPCSSALPASSTPSALGPCYLDHHLLALRPCQLPPRLQPWVHATSSITTSLLFGLASFL